MRTKSKTGSDFLAFPSVKFRKIWQTGSKYVTLVGDHFFRKGKRHKSAFKTKTQNFNKDDSKTLFYHCLLQLISLRGLGVKANAKEPP